ncbi:MAG: hypothetical protein ACE5F6_05090 [Anaerolineae bacterium]
MLLVDSGLLEPERVKLALEATFQTRNTHRLRSRLPAPPADWTEPYAALAQELRLPVLTLPEAHTYLDDYWQTWELGQNREQDL